MLTWCHTCGNYQIEQNEGSKRKILYWDVKTSSKDYCLMYREKGYKKHWPEQVLFPQLSSDTLSTLEKAYIWTASWTGFEGANMKCFDKQ